MDHVNHLDLGADHEAPALSSHAEFVPPLNGVGEGEDHAVRYDAEEDKTVVG